MKLASVFLFAASVVLSCLTTNAQDGSSNSNISVSSPLKTSNSTVPKGTKTCTTSLRVNASKNNFAAGILISPNHVLTGGASVGADIRYASIGSHYNNGTEDGEQIKVVAILAHPNISEESQYADDFVVLQLERPSSFKPITFGGVSDITDGETVTKLGWYNTGGQDQHAHELQRADVQLMSNEECSKVTSVDDSRMCSHPVGNENSCTGDYGGPLIVERPEGDILVGMVSWGDDCKKPGYPSYYSRLPVGREWIESIIRGECFH